MARFRSSGKRTYSGRKPSILFLSTGNTCRSPMAYGVMRNLLAEAGIDRVEVRTAGVMTIPGLLPTQECRQILEKEGIEIEGHRSSQLTPETIKRATLVLGMTSFHVQMALRMSDYAQGKTFLLKGMTGSDPKNDQIQDPMGCTLEVYKKVFREIRASCRKLMKKVEVFEILLGDSDMARRIVEGKPPKNEKAEGATAAVRSRKKRSTAAVEPAAEAAEGKSAAAPEEAAAETPAEGEAPKKAKAKAPAGAEKPSKKDSAAGKSSPKAAAKKSEAPSSEAPKSPPKTPKKPSAKKSSAPASDGAGKADSEEGAQASTSPKKPASKSKKSSTKPTSGKPKA